MDDLFRSSFFLPLVKNSSNYAFRKNYDKWKPPHNQILELNETLGKLYTPEEVAEFLKVAPSTVYNWVQTGKIECYVLSRGKRKSTVRFDNQQIQRFMKSRSILK